MLIRATGPLAKHVLPVGGLHHLAPWKTTDAELARWAERLPGPTPPAPARDSAGPPQVFCLRTGSNSFQIASAPSPPPLQPRLMRGRGYPPANRNASGYRTIPQGRYGWVVAYRDKVEAPLRDCPAPAWGPVGALPDGP